MNDPIRFFKIKATAVEKSFYLGEAITWLHRDIMVENIIRHRGINGIKVTLVPTFDKV
jgi:hypothetical protein